MRKITIDKNDEKYIYQEMLNVWNELKTLVRVNEIDVYKNANGNQSAAVRARHGYTLLITLNKKLLALSLKASKLAVAAKQAQEK